MTTTPHRLRPSREADTEFLQIRPELVRPVAPEPVSRFDWERVVKRAPMPKGAKFLALVLATFSASKDGTNVRPSVERLAREMEVSERTVNRGMVWLRDAGWIVRVRQGNRWQGRTDEYRLSFPGDVLDRLWLDPDGAPLGDTHVAQTPSVQATPMSPRLIRDADV